MKFADGRYKGVTVEANYDVGEYDVSILSASESDGLVNYLTDNGYRIPAGADAVLGSYIKQKMRFFVAKVNLERMQALTGSYLRPLQVRYEIGEIHAAAAARHRERARPAGPHHPGAQQERPDRDRELPHREAAVRTSRCRSTSSRTSARSTRRCSTARSNARRCRRCSSNMPGTWAGAIPARPIR